MKKMELGEYQARLVSEVYKRAAKRLGLDLSQPLTAEDRCDLEDEVIAVLAED